jgi:hypothetical protein
MLKVAVFFVIATSSQASSFSEVRDKVYASPMTGLPQYEGLGAGDFIRALFHLPSRLTDRARGTLGDAGDFKAAAPKLLHPMGVCAEAVWEIDAPSSSTGLLAQGTRVNAIVRMSAADTQTKFSFKKKRTFGLAVKLFPTANPDLKVTTRNLFLLDQNGLTGSKCENYLLNRGEERFFQNTALGGGFGAKLVSRIFRRFDRNPLMRPVRPLAEVTAQNVPVGVPPVSPELLQLVPTLSEGAALRSALDFRGELLQYAPGEIRFDIVVPGQGRIGRLTLGKPVLSAFCDKQLHFHHHRW